MAKTGNDYYKRQSEEKRAHGESLKKFFRLKAGVNAFTLVMMLQSIERRAHKVAERYCNGEMKEESRDRSDERCLEQLRVIGLDTSKVFINGDPRGYALKIREEFSKDFDGVKDWGGYGIIAPEFHR